MCVISSVCLLGNLDPSMAANPPGECLCRLAKDDITESSGLAVSRRCGEVLWTHNDSGDKPRLFAFNQRGEHLGTSYLIGAEAIDWEDMGAFSYNSQAYLFVADVGDNLRERDEYQIYVAREPKSPKKDTKAIVIRFTYEDGPHNCEAVAYDPIERTFLFVEKQLALTSRVYEFAWPRRDQNKPLVARQIGTLPVPLVTAMDISADGRQLIVASYGNGYRLERNLDEGWRDALTRPGYAVEFPERRQGETVCFSPDASTIFLTSEKKPCPLFAVPNNTRPPTSSGRDLPSHNSPSPD